MLHQKMTKGLLLAAALTVFTSASAFAAPQQDQKAAAAVPASMEVGMSVKAEGVSGENRKKPETDENGQQYFMTEDGSKIYVSFCEGTPKDCDISVVPAGK